VLLVLVLLVGLPVLEIVVMVLVAQAVGILDMLGLLVACSLVGLWLVRHQGLGTMARVRAELDAGRVPGAELVDGLLLLVAGFLLLVPGFVTDAIGLVLLVPPVRRGTRALLARRMATRRTRWVRSRVWITERGPSRPEPERFEPRGELGP